jgi:hypothetical protein
VSGLQIDSMPNDENVKINNHEMVISDWEMKWCDW